MNFREIGLAEENELQRQKLQLRADFTELLTRNVNLVEPMPKDIDFAAANFDRCAEKHLGGTDPERWGPVIHGLLDQVRSLRGNATTVRQAIADFKKVTGDQLWGSDKRRRDLTQYEKYFHSINNRLAVGRGCAGAIWRAQSDLERLITESSRLRNMDPLISGLPPRVAAVPIEIPKPKPTATPVDANFHMDEF